MVKIAVLTEITNIIHIMIHTFPSIYNLSLVSFPEAVCRNRHFEKPTRSEFQAHMREALRVAKERCRNKMRGSRTRTAVRRDTRRDFWSDERPEDNDDDDDDPEENGN